MQTFTATPHRPQFANNVDTQPPPLDLLNSTPLNPSAPEDMDSRFSTLEPTSPDVAVPRPPGKLFRVVRRLSMVSNGRSGVYLCLPRELPPPFVPETSIDYNFQASVAKEHATFIKMPNTRMHQQMWLLEYPRVGDAFCHAVNFNGVSALKQKYVNMLPQLVVVKMAVEPRQVKKEGEFIEILHRGREYSTLHIGSSILESQITSNASSTWLCLRPVFGPRLAQFGEAASSSTSGGIPSWFVAHIFLALIDAVEFVHKDRLMHNKIYTSNIMLNMYPSYMHHRYRGYPDIQLIDFSDSIPLETCSTENDVLGILIVMEQVIRKWSDAAPFLAIQAAGEETDDATVLMFREIQDVLDDVGGVFTLEKIKRTFALEAEETRNTGPETIPRDLMKLLHSDLVTEGELEFALRKPSVLKLGTKRAELRRIMESVPVTMGSGGHAGMKTGRILVVRFTTRKAEFLKIVGEDYEEVDDMETEDYDADSEENGFELEDMEMEDDE